MNYDLSSLILAEKLWLWRNRTPSRLPPARGHRRDRLNIAEASALLDLPVTQYRTLESGQSLRLRIDQWEKLKAAIAFSVPLSKREQCLLARRRSGIRLLVVAKTLGLSINRTLMLEDKADPRLIQYWEAQGFGFTSYPTEESEACSRTSVA